MMNGIPQLKVPALAAALLALATWGAAPSAVAECSCMCIDGVSYEVCIGVVTTQTETQQCTEQLQCPTAPETDPGESVEPPAETAGQDLDCRQRQVYRPDLGEYKMHTVCMPAARTEAHDRLTAKRQEMSGKFAEKTQRSNAGRGPH